jgi:hypothetical protein
MLKKILVTSGCSFTFEDWNWQGHLARILNLDLINTGLPSQGNGLISRKLIHSLSEVINTYKSEEILVGVMWSGIDRHEFYNPKYNKTIDWGSENSKNNDPRVKNPTEVVSTKNNWYILNHHWNNKESVNFYSNYHDHISSMVYTIEHILRVQMFLERNKIDYFMSSYLSIFSNEETINHEEVKYLFDLIDFDKFLPVSGCHEWVKENYGENGGFNDPDQNGYIGVHPTSFGHQKFTEEVIIPFLNK